MSQRGWCWMVPIVGEANWWPSATTPQKPARTRLITRILGLVQECRAILPELEPPVAETPGAQAERHLYIALLGVLADGLVRTVDEALVMLRQASQPLGPMGAEWLEAQERRLQAHRPGDDRPEEV